MPQRTLTHLYPTYAEAVQVVADLTAMGVDTGNISLIESEADARLPPDVARDEARNPTVSGATIGGAIGAAIGALAGVGAVNIPYTGPLVALGWFAPMLVGGVIGAVLGAVIGTLTKVGVAGPQAHQLAAGLQRGEHLVMVRVEEAYAPQVQAILTKVHVLPPATPLPEPAFDEGYRQPEAHPAADIHREERRIQYE